ncbi:MAG: hypothetical protein HOD85_29835 [Deltaproteobacteria bacterium]|jgi:hypothetical protein|nr:hypothetical protein [Deltaproteobacteria bacterium]MBT4642678.1 hypothetical protein [Deltaproteobacteria bacterium]
MQSKGLSRIGTTGPLIPSLFCMDLIKLADLSDFDAYKLSRKSLKKRAELEKAMSPPPDITA